MLRPFSVALVCFALASTSASWAATPLAPFVGRWRVLVVSSASTTDLALARQTRWLAAAAAGLRDRDVVVIRIVANAVDAPPKLNLDSHTLRDVLGLKADRFGLALIGKDGHEVFDRRAPITMRSLFAAIDAMPMRRDEMKQRRP